MPNYLNGKIYEIRSHQTEQVYIGSTVERLSARMSKHRADFKRYKAGKMNYITSFKMLDYPDAYIELVEKHPCLCREELERLEGQHIFFFFFEGAQAPIFMNKKKRGGEKGRG